MRFNVCHDNSDSELILTHSKPFTDSDWPLCFIIRVLYTAAYDSEWAKQAKYHCEVQVASPQAAGNENCLQAAESCGQSITDFQTLPLPEQCVILLQYGVSACLWQKGGNHLKQLLKLAKEEVKKMEIMFGMHMDCKLNSIGSTGWDFIKGDILRPLREHQECTP